MPLNKTKNNPIHELFLESLQRYKERILFSSLENNRDVTFNAYYEFVQEIQTTIHKKGIKPGSKIGVIISDKILFSIIGTSILIDSFVLIPISSEATSFEVQQIIQHSKLNWIVEDKSFFTKNNVNFKHTILGIETFWSMVLAKTSHDSSDVAVILYTSGSSGNPKGVLLTHKNLLLNAQYIKAHYALNEMETTLNVLPLYHIHGFMLNFLVPITVGCRVYFPHKVDLLKIWNWIEKYKINWITTVPSIISILLLENSPEKLKLESLRFVRVGSASLGRENFYNFEEKFKIPILPGFGMTEGACVITGNPPPPGRRKAGSSGKAIGDFKIQIVNDQDEVVPVGTIGHLRIKGDCVFKGYFDNESETQKALRDSWLYTSDLAYLDDEDYLFVVGRKTDIIEVSSEKVYPQEIEELITAIEGVLDVAVVGTPHPLSGEIVTAIVCTNENESRMTDKINEVCQVNLSVYKRPKKIIFTDKIQKGKLGKINRKELASKYARD